MTIKELKEKIKDIPDETSVYITHNEKDEDGNSLIEAANFVEDVFLVTHSDDDGKNGFYLVM